MPDVRSLKSRSQFSERLRLVESRHNPLIKTLRRAFDHGELTEDGCCAAEGIKIVEEAIRSGLKIRAVFFRDGAPQAAERLLPQLGNHVETVVMPPKLFDAVVPSDTPQGVAALIKVKSFDLEAILMRLQIGPVIALAGLQDPGNLGTILRSAEAFGTAGVLLGEKTVSPFNAKAIRASAGSVFRVPTVQAPAATSIPRLREAGIVLFGTSSHRGKPLPETDLSKPTAFFVGNEGSGLTRDLLNSLDETVFVPQQPSVESLNAGVATSILLYEAARQRGLKASSGGIVTPG